MIVRPSNASSILSVIRSINDSSESNYKSLEKLSSGLRINRASDGPAELVISEQFRSQIASLNQEIKNHQNNIGKYETASSYVSTMRSQLTELRSLAIGAANTGFNSDNAQQAYTNEANQIIERYNETLFSAEYNGFSLFTGGTGSLADLTPIDPNNIDFSNGSSVNAAIESFDSYIAEIDSVQINLGATQKNQFESELQSLYVTRENLLAADSQIRSTDYAMEISKLMIERVRMKASMALLSHQYVHANTITDLLHGS